MKKILFAVLAVALLTGVSLAQSSAASQTNATASQNASASTAQATDSGQIAAGTTIRAEVAKSVDAKKAKQGDEVVAKTTEDVKSNGQVVIPKGSKIVGHVTEAKAREKGESESALGIAFDKALVKGGREIPLNATIQALAASQSNVAANEPVMEPGAPGNSSGNMAPGRAGNGGMIGGAAQTAGTAAGTATNAAGNVGTTAGSTAAAGSNARLSASSQGVAGLPGLSLSSAAANNTQASVISSQNKNVKLDSGTQMLLRVNSK